MPDCLGNELFSCWFGVALLIVLELFVFFLEYFVAAVAEAVTDDAKEVELSSEAASAFVFRIVKCSFAVELDDVCEEIGVAIKEVFILVLVKEYISSGASEECV